MKFPNHSEKNEVEEKFIEQLDKFDGKNHQILTLFHKTCANVIKLVFCHFDTAIEVSDFLASRYSISDDVHQFQLYCRLHLMQQ